MLLLAGREREDLAVAHPDGADDAQLRQIRIDVAAALAMILHVADDRAHAHFDRELLGHDQLEVAHLHLNVDGRGAGRENGLAEVELGVAPEHADVEVARDRPRSVALDAAELDEDGVVLERRIFAGAIRMIGHGSSAERAST